MIRIGSVPYLNARVLVHGLQPRTDRYTFETHVPSLLARKLRDGQVDVALVSSIEFFRNPDYVMLPNLCVSGHREMWSIRLFHRVPLREARRVGCDPASETTNALLQIILYEKMQLGVELVPLTLGADPTAREDLDGFLLIGDPCLTFRPPAGYQALDLCAEWFDFTSLPFVFAVWVTPLGIDLEGINKDLYLAKREGLRNFDPIARAEAPKIGLDYLRVKTYISKIVHYDLGRMELAGLSLFQKYLLRQRLIFQQRDLEFYTR